MANGTAVSMIRRSSSSIALSLNNFLQDFILIHFDGKTKTFYCSLLLVRDEIDVRQLSLRLPEFVQTLAICLKILHTQTRSEPSCFGIKHSTR